MLANGANDTNIRAIRATRCRITDWLSGYHRYAPIISRQELRKRRGYGDRLNAQMTACNELHRGLKFVLTQKVLNYRKVFRCITMQICDNMVTAIESKLST